MNTKPNLTNLLTSTDNSVEISLEDGYPLIDSFKAMQGYMANFFNKANIVLKSPDIKPAIYIDHDLRDAVKILDKQSSLTLMHFTVIVPEQLNGNMTGYLKDVETIYDLLSTVENRLLIPLENWAANIISTPGFDEKIWMDLPRKFIDIEKTKKDLSKHFNNSVGDDYADRLFKEVYGNTHQMIACYAQTKKLNEHVLMLLDGRLTTRINKITELYDRILKISQTNTMVSKLSHEQIRPLAAVMLQAAKEIELLSIVMFQIRAVNWGETQTIDKIKKAFK